ncbi:DUF2147 domain-containing protein [Rubellimicrobium sp. CFH 75288]|uniref:DUF2147 domain-containing protein n=1 Tax=Rubellimicrobium sp. CFH 75288 TaxID=2697034 RepID=UPI001412FBE4|nr:DUF2147 domain-containing protein [Rubellimicrobium sp. CFH 75288]NAZ35461.1 DUF2147 domain-containing protein [Rubellimicrobium sp. CFH 75288]
MTRLAALAAALALGATAAAAEPLLGTWRTAPDDNGNTGLIQVAPCGDAICGALVRAFGPDGSDIPSPNMGRLIIWDTRPTGGGEYRGRIFAPDRGQEYASRLRLDGDRLSVSGCVIGICREGGVWTRVN